jgi:hypothetical protein
LDLSGGNMENSTVKYPLETKSASHSVGAFNGYKRMSAISTRFILVYLSRSVKGKLRLLFSALPYLYFGQT